MENTLPPPPSYKAAKQDQKVKFHVVHTPEGFANHHAEMIEGQGLGGIQTGRWKRKKKEKSCFICVLQ